MKKTPAPRRVTLQDIGRKIGVSHVTVSMALHGSKRISVERRKQIQILAQRMGYRPDPMLSALTHYRNGKRKVEIRAAIAWLNLWANPKKLRSLMEFDGYWHGAVEVAQAHGYHLEEFAVGASLPLSRLNSILQARNIQGILLPPCNKAGLLGPADLKWENYATVCFGHSHTRLPVHMVTADQVAAARIAFEAINERGYQRIGLVTLESSNFTFFPAGYMHTQLRMNPGEALPVLILPASRKQGSSQLRHWLKKHRPDAIITDHADAPALLRTIGVRVPADVGLAALSVLDGKADAGINQNAVEIGRVAAETVISLINHNHRGIPPFQRHILVEGLWIDGSTLPPRKFCS